MGACFQWGGKSALVRSGGISRLHRGAKEPILGYCGQMQVIAAVPYALGLTAATPPFRRR